MTEVYRIRPHPKKIGMWLAERRVFFFFWKPVEYLFLGSSGRLYENSVAAEHAIERHRKALYRIKIWKSKKPYKYPSGN